jgi:hypothetical protein
LTPDQEEVGFCLWIMFSWFWVTVCSCFLILYLFRASHWMWCGLENVFISGRYSSFYKLICGVELGSVQILSSFRAYYWSWLEYVIGLLGMLHTFNHGDERCVVEGLRLDGI